MRWTSRSVPLAVVVAVLLLVPITPAAAETISHAPGSLTEVEVTTDLNCRVEHIDDSRSEFFGDTACATLVATGGTLFGPDRIPAGSSAGPRTTFTEVSQSAVTGSGSPSDPFRIETVVGMDGTTLSLTQVDTYVAGEESYRTDVTLSNTGEAGVGGILYRAGDCFLQDSDSGFGRQGPAGAVACVAPDPGDSSVAGDRIEQWLPLTPGSTSYEAGYSQVWSRIGDQLPFDNTCRCDERIDNGAGLSWEFALPPSGSQTYSHLTTFSPLGRVPLTTTKTAADSPVEPGAADSYTLTIENSNTDDVEVAEVVDTLPAGFTYTPGSTTGVTTTDPTVSGTTLTWTGPFTAPAGASISLTFGVTVSDTPGTYFNEATGRATGTAVTPTGPTAPVEVVEGDPPRIDGEGVTRVAINLCTFLFSTPDSARTVVLARADLFADALAGSALAADDSCILYTPGGPDASLDPETGAEIDRVLPDGGRVRIMGGPAAVSSGVEAELAGAGYAVERFGGSNRFETAELIARRVAEERPGNTDALLASGGDFPDAVTGGAYGAATGTFIVLTERDALSPAAERALTEHGITTTHVLGGPTVISDAVVGAVPGGRRVAGENRMATAVEVAETLWPSELSGSPDAVVVTNIERDDGWALTLASAPLSARDGAPQVGVGADRYPDETEAYLEGLMPPAGTAFVIGGTDSVSESVGADIAADVGEETP